MNAPSIRQMADDHPGSVWQSIVDYVNWTQKLDVSATAKRLTRLSGPQFRYAVTKLLTVMNADNESNTERS